jgi:hypothetical protein
VLVSDAFSSLRSILEGASIRYAVGDSWASTAFGLVTERAALHRTELMEDWTLARAEAQLKSGRTAGTNLC